MRGAGSTPATATLASSAIEFTLHPYEHDPRTVSYGLEAAQALGVEPRRVYKTLVADLDTELVVGIVPVTSLLDLKALAQALGGKKAHLADPAIAQRATGYVVGGISPIGQRRRHRTALDTSAADWATVYVSGGRRGLDIELTPDALVAATGAVTATIARSVSRS